MDKEEIIEIAQNTTTPKQLLDLLNKIKKSLLENCGLGDKYYPFTPKQINYYCNPKHTHHRYKHFEIPKKSGGTRQITAPKNKSFMALLRCVNILLKAIYIPSKYAMGFAEDKCIADNAKLHIGKNYVFNIDLKDFFPSIEQPRVWKRLQIAPFNFPKEIANIIAGLCCMKVSDDLYVLPQGAPTSPIITNMICDKLDHRLAGLAKRFNLTYSRYADDITFSSMHNVYQSDGDFMKELERIVASQNFAINKSKTRLQKRGARQEVTGIIVSDKINVTQKYVRDLRNILYIGERYGFNCAYMKFQPKYKSEKGHVKKGNPNMINVLDGKLMYLKMVKGENDSVYQRLSEKFNILVETLDGTRRNSLKNITYNVTTPVLEFEDKNKTIINLVLPKNKNEKVKRRASFVLNGDTIIASIKNDVLYLKDNIKETLSISNCVDKQGKQFWLIHKTEYVVENPKIVDSITFIDIDELNNDLDDLIENG